MTKTILAILFVLIQAQGYCQLRLEPCSKRVSKVDVVYTWVDGSDPIWQQNYALAKRARSHPKTKDAITKARFRNHDELKYSLRSIWKYAPFVNHIYIVTADQMPCWLKPHPKITVVAHREIFLNQQDLPTFNSQAIEANLHRIPNLSECYLYFNDDVFLGAPMKRQDFFSKSGKPKMFLASWIAPDGEVGPGDTSFEASWKNTNALLNRFFGNKSRYALAHAPFAFRISQQNAIEKAFSALFKEVSSHKFRSPDDILVTAGFSQHYLDAYKLVKRTKVKSEVIGLKDNIEHNRKKLSRIIKSRPTTFCLEDAMKRENPEQDVIIKHFLESYFPDPAPWEI